MGQCQASKFWILQPGGADPSTLCFFYFLSVNHYSDYAMLAWRPRNWEEPTKRALFGLCSLTVDVLPEGGAVMYFLSTLNVVKLWVHFIPDLFIYTFFHLKSNKLNIVHQLMWIYIFCVKKQKNKNPNKCKNTSKTCEMRGTFLICHGK